MTIANLVTALTIIFVVSVVFLIAELLFILRRRRYFPPKPPISGDEKNPKLLYFFCLKSEPRVEPSEPPKADEHSPDDHVIDVFKMLESNGPSRVLCTIKEDDREEIESTSTSLATKKVTLKACLESERAEEVEVVVEGGMVVNSPCDSPMFFTPMGSPARDGMIL